MTDDKSDDALLWDMLDAAKAIQQFVAGKTFEDYVMDRMLRGAVERHIEIIGEAAKHVSTTFQKGHLDIPWRGIVGQRNVLAHDYGEIKNERIWRVATDMIPDLIHAIGALIPNPPPDPKATA